jgi:hypothetical protein
MTNFWTGFGPGGAGGIALPLPDGGPFTTPDFRPGGEAAIC